MHQRHSHSHSGVLCRLCYLALFSKEVGGFSHSVISHLKESYLCFPGCQGPVWAVRVNYKRVLHLRRGAVALKSYLTGTV